MGSLPYVPHPRDDSKGGACPPLWIPPQALYLSFYSVDSPGGRINRNFSISQFTFSALGVSFVSTYWM